MAQFALPDIAGRFQQGQRRQQQMNLADMQMDRTEQAMGRQEQLRNTLGRLPNVQQEQRPEYLGQLASQGPEGLDMAGRVQQMWAGMDAQQRAETQEGLKRNMRMLAGVNDQESYDTVRQMAIQRAPEMAEQLPEEYDPNAVDAMINQFREIENIIGGDGVGDTKVQSSKILDDGTVVSVLSDGTRRVTGPSGEPIRGEAAQKAIRDAQEFGVDLQSRRAGGRTRAKLEERTELEPELQDRITRAKEGAKNATGKVADFFDQLASVESNIANYDQAIKALEEGAQTGAVARRLPSVRASSVKLENAINNLGLNVIQNTTFGSLSEAELDFALRSSVPDNLPEEELKQFLQEKKQAQQKVADYLSNAIEFLSIPGNTLADLQATNPRQNARRDGGQPAQPSGQQPGTQEPAQPQTESEYEALPSGALFVDPDDGKTYRKP